MKNFIILVVIVCLTFIACGKSPEKEAAVNDPKIASIKAYLQAHDELGSFSSFSALPDWAQGKRYTISTTSASYQFYLLGNEVVGVDRLSKDGGTEKIFHKETPLYSENISKPASGDIPEYKILFKVPLSDGSGIYADILISSFSKQTPVSEREIIVRAIAAKEKFSSISLYCTEDAQKANDSATYSKSHPGVLEKGYLGSLQGGVFTSK